MKVTKLPEDYEEFQSDEITEEQQFIAEKLYEFLTSLIIDTNIDEQFGSENSLSRHFRKHCLAGIPNRTSSRTNVYYDFTTVEEYSEQEQRVFSEVTHTQNFVTSLYDVDVIIPAVQKLYNNFEPLYFTPSCGIKGYPAYVSVGFCRTIPSGTSNYGSDTANIIIIGQNNRTSTLYAVDLEYLTTKLNNIISDKSAVGAKLRFRQEKK